VIFCFFSLVRSAVYAQHIQLKGSVADTSERAPLIQASVVLLGEKDSIIISDTRTSFDGSFIFNSLPSGSYVLMITSPGYIDFVQRGLVLPRPAGANLGKISLVKEATFLKEVLITGRRIPVRFKGDTTEFDASAYKLSPNASVEDLLKKLPGLQVDFYGNITAQGKRVTQVLVDGEEFFGNDPVLVTRNLRADMIDKVQVYDKKSDRAQFTGIDDGKKQKTVNVQLKKDKKTGFFGKLDGNLATKGYYQNGLMFNRFNGDEKFAFYGFTNNNGAQGLSRNDIEIYSSNEDNIQLASNELVPWSGSYDGKGMPKIIAGGLHYNNKWNEGRQSINGDYKINDFSVNGIDSKDVQSNLPESVLITSSKQHFNNSLLKNTFNIGTKLQLDASSSLNINFKGGIEDKKTGDTFSSQTITDAGAMANKSFREFITTSNNDAITSDQSWSKKFKKDRRTITISASEYLNHNKSDGTLQSMITVYNSPDSVNNGTNQLKANRSSNQNIYSRIDYTEPLSPSSSLLLNYGISGNSAASKRNTFTILAGNKPGPLDSLYSVDYKLNQFTQRGGAAYNYNKNKVRFQAGTDLSAIRFSQHNLFDGTIYKRNFTRWNPSAEFSYAFSSLNAISFNYSGNTSLPTIGQIEPIVNNIDPLNIIVGNAGLNPYFTHSSSVNYVNYLMATSTFFNAHIEFSFVDKPIASVVQTDTSVRIIYTFKNLNGRRNANYSGGFLYSTKVKFWELILGIDGNFSGGSYSSVINKEMNITHTGNYNFNLNLSKQKDKKYFIGASFGAIYNLNNSLLKEKILKNSSFGYTIKPIVEIYFPSNFQFHSDGDYQLQGKTQNFSNTYERFIWNAAFQKGITKDNNLTAKILVNDILNQNIGFSRGSMGNLIIQDSYNTIRRYFMISVTWNFNKFKK
jgi:hypothetical protein